MHKTLIFKHTLQLNSKEYYFKTSYSLTVIFLLRILRKPLEIVVGQRSTVAADVTQIIEVRPEETKFRRLLELMKEWHDKGSIYLYILSLFAKILCVCQSMFRK